MMDLIQDLTCPVCLELFNHPVILPCSHVLCRRPCAETIFEASLVRCPVCRENCGIKGGVRNLPRVITIENIIEKVRVWQTAKEDGETKAATSLAPNLTNDSGLSTICENIGTCLPIRSLNYSPTSSVNGYSIKEAGLKSINQNKTTNQKMHSCQECTNKTIHPSSPESKIAASCHVIGMPDCSSSEMKFVTLASGTMSATAHGQAYTSRDCRVDQARSSHVDGRLERQVQEQLRKLSEARCQLLDKVSLYRKYPHVLEDHGMAWMPTAPMLMSRLSAVVLKCKLCRMTFDSRIRSTQHAKHRAEQRDTTHPSRAEQRGTTYPSRAEQRDTTHPSIPSQPIIDVHRSSRSNNLVALVICPPPSCDAINSYEITYFPEEEKHQNVRKHQNAKWPINSRSVLKKVTFLLIEGLSASTNYYFNACAVNSAGRSPSSDHVKCRTLGQAHCVVPVPVITKNLCRASAKSATILCPSPGCVTRPQGVTYFVLHRQDGGDFAWHGEELGEMEEHRVERLEPGTDYQFVVLACNLRGECQISEKITLTTCFERLTDCVQ